MILKVWAVCFTRKHKAQFHLKSQSSLGTSQHTFTPNKGRKEELRSSQLSDVFTASENKPHWEGKVRLHLWTSSNNKNTSCQTPGSQTERFSDGTDGKYEHLQAGSRTPRSQTAGTVFFFATAASKSFHSILHAALARNRSWFGAAIGGVFFQRRLMFCQAVIISPASCIFTVTTLHWADSLQNNGRACSNMLDVRTASYWPQPVRSKLWSINQCSAAGSLCCKSRHLYLITRFLLSF